MKYYPEVIDYLKKTIASQMRNESGAYGNFDYFADRYVTDMLKNGLTVEQIAAGRNIDISAYEIPLLEFGELPKKQYIDKSKAGRDIIQQTSTADADTQTLTVFTDLTPTENEYTVVFQFDFSNIQLSLSKPITREDIRFMLAIYTYVKYNHRINDNGSQLCMGADELYKMLGYNENTHMTAKQYQYINDTWDRLSQTRISYNMEEQYKRKGMKVPRNIAIIDSTPLLCPRKDRTWMHTPTDRVLKRFYFLPNDIQKVSPFINYIQNKIVNGTYLVDRKYLSLPTRYSEEKQALLEQIVIEIFKYKRGIRNNTSIVYQTLFETCNINPTTSRAKQNMVDNVTEILEHLKITGLITDYQDKITRCTNPKGGKPSIYNFTFQTEKKESAKNTKKRST